MPTPPKVIGLTGGIGSGKSYIAQLLADLGALIVDADAVSRELTAVGGAAIPLIAQTLGIEFVGADGSLDRNKMRVRAFSDAKLKLQLEAILHPLIRHELDRQIAEFIAQSGTQYKYVVAEIPLLYASRDYAQRYARIAVVDCSVAQQVSRVKARSNLSTEIALAIVATQTARSLRLQLADDVISNEGENPALMAQVRALHEKYLKLN
jgi:dephospho-CoA kinase